MIPKDKNRGAVGRIIGVSLLPPLCGSNKWYWLPGVAPVCFTPGYYLITPTVFGDNYNAKKVWLIMSKNIAHGFEKSWAMFFDAVSLPMQAYLAGIYFVRLERQVVGVVKR